jgi:hypothetical protein
VKDNAHDDDGWYRDKNEFQCTSSQLSASKRDARADENFLSLHAFYLLLAGHHGIDDGRVKVTRLARDQLKNVSLATGAVTVLSPPSDEVSTRTGAAQRRHEP